MPPLCCTECNSTDLAYEPPPPSTSSSFPQPTPTHSQQEGGDLVCQACGYVVEEEEGNLTEEGAIQDYKNPASDSLQDQVSRLVDGLELPLSIKLMCCGMVGRAGPLAFVQKYANDLEVSAAALVFLATRSSIPTLTLTDICDCNRTGSTNRMRGNCSSGSGRLSKLEVGRRAVHLERAMMK